MVDWIGCYVCSGDESDFAPGKSSRPKDEDENSLFAFLDSVAKTAESRRHAVNHRIRALKVIIFVLEKFIRVSE